MNEKNICHNHKKSEQSFPNAHLEQRNEVV